MTAVKVDKYDGNSPSTDLYPKLFQWKCLHVVEDVQLTKEYRVQ